MASQTAGGGLGNEAVIESKNLKHVFLLFRHGKRAPIPPLPPDVDGVESDWPAGLMNLTTQGKAQMYEIGQHFRQIYSSYLTDDPREVYALSRTVSRCYESVACLLAGMYPPKHDWIWNKELQWQPIQIFPEECRQSWNFFRRYSEGELQILSKLSAPKPFTTAKDLLSYVTKKFELDDSRLYRAEVILQYFVCRKAHGYSVPEWIEKNWEAFTWACNLCIDLRCDASKVALARNALTLIRKTLNEKFFDKNNGSTTKKITAYCFSDINLGAVLKLLGSDVTTLSPFGATLAIEVFSKCEEGGLFVKVVYVPDIKKEPEILKLSPCKNPCSLEEFLKIVDSGLEDGKTDGKVEFFCEEM